MKKRSLQHILVNLGKDQIKLAQKLADVRGTPRSVAIRELIDRGIRSLGKFD